MLLFFLNNINLVLVIYSRDFICETLHGILDRGILDSDISFDLNIKQIQIQIEEYSIQIILENIYTYWPCFQHQ